MENIKIPWPQWRAVRLLGRGGFGCVYEIERELYESREKAAMKVITIPKDQSEVEADFNDGYDKASVSLKYEAYLKQIVNEYELMSGIKGHSNIVSCDDFYTEAHKDGIGWDIYIRMELLTPLSSRLRECTLTEEEVVQLGRDICRALAVCESKNIIHRDIKPENIMISDFGAFKLGDFGIARTMDHTTNATFAGTERYMAPEVIRHEKYGKEVDIYSLGLVMYWLLNRRRMPFLPLDRLPSAGEAQAAQAKRVQGRPLPPPADGSEALKQIVMKACAYDRRARYRSAEEMLSDLESLRRAPAPGSFVPEGRTAGPDSFPEPGEPSAKTVGNSWNDTDKTIGRPPQAGGNAPASGEDEGTVGAQPLYPPQAGDAAQKGGAPQARQKEPDKPSKYYPFWVGLWAAFGLIIDIMVTGKLTDAGSPESSLAALWPIIFMIPGLCLLFGAKRSIGAVLVTIGGEIAAALYLTTYTKTSYTAVFVVYMILGLSVLFQGFSYAKFHRPKEKEINRLAEEMIKNGTAPSAKEIAKRIKAAPKQPGKPGGGQTK